MSLKPLRNVEDWIDSYIELTDNSEPHELYRRWTAISVIAATLQRKCGLRWLGNTPFYPNLYVVIVGPPAARKGTALGQGRSFLNHLGISTAADDITRQALIQSFEEASNTVVLENQSSIIHSSLTVFSPELTVFLGYNDNDFMTSLTDWFDCPEKWTYKTKGAGTNEIVNLYLNLIGATTPSLIRTSLPMDTIGSGLASRIIFVYQPKAGRKIARPFKTEKEKQLEAMLQNDLEQIFLMKGTFKPTTKFLDLYDDWYINKADSEEINQAPKFEHYCARRQLHLLKLCMIFSASRSSKLILDEVDFVRAHSLLTYTESKMHLTFAGVGQSNYANVTQNIYLDVSQQKKISRADLLRKYYNDVNAQELDIILNTLEEAKIIKKIIDGGSGIWIELLEQQPE